MLHYILHILQVILDWSEVWALLIPAAISVYRKQPVIHRPVVFYIWIALLINSCIDIVWKFRTLLPLSFSSNNWLYNLHSVVTFFLFSSFFIGLEQPFLVRIKKIVLIAFIVFLVINFMFYENFFDYWRLSSRLLSVEAILLLFYSLSYFLFKVHENVNVNIFTSDFWIATGLGLYVAVNFFIFLLYNELTVHMINFAINLWNVHNISYIFFNFFIAKGFYDSGRH
ncbi:hypothetical protein AY601_1515 [Pedobacter cryoconitis]|uniref:Uncharacterized protein n=1 Tax=Pedobacter cryoconitis TaxID=188932 RepID=A0A127VAK6_9SPHI|nr:hypothetical protein AY601_1515 [Pedobacter cryoconitis]